MKTITEQQMLDKIKKEVRALGSQKAFAVKYKIGEAHLSDFLQGRRDITDKISVPLGYKRKVVFEKVEK